MRLSEQVEAIGVSPPSSTPPQIELENADPHVEIVFNISTNDNQKDVIVFEVVPYLDQPDKIRHICPIMNFERDINSDRMDKYDTYALIAAFLTIGRV